MSAQQVFDLNRKYQARINYLLENLPVEVSPSVEQHVFTQARNLYVDMLEMGDTSSIDYTRWLEIITKFYNYAPLVAVDTDSSLTNIAKKILGHPSLMAYFKEYVDTGVPLDTLQLQLTINQFNRYITN